MNNNEYKCTVCKNIYQKGWTDEEAQDESENNFGHYEPEELDVICDDCYNEMMKPSKINKAL